MVFPLAPENGIARLLQAGPIESMTRRSWTMAQTKTWRMDAAGAEIYEWVRVPGEFEQLARMLLDRVGLERGQTVLDVACGTGIVARLAAGQVGESGQVTGLDRDGAMLAVARAHAPRAGAPLAWREGDALALPFAAGAFDVVLCQQGLQFFPDRPGALREMKRVLAPGGRFGACLWQSSDQDPFSIAAGEALARHVSREAAEQARYAFGDADELRALIEEAGFREVEVSPLTVSRRMGPPAESIPLFFASSGRLSSIYASLEPAIRAALVEDISRSVRPYVSGNGMEIPRGTLIATARN
jgi:ubiquinone/menaquinone biosynthesis C-methylase UbiE